MKFFSEIRRIFKCNNLCISERLNTVEATFVITFQSLPDAETIKSTCALAPTRDALTLTIKNDSDDIIVISNVQAKEPDFSALTDGLVEDDNINVSIRIDKIIAGDKFSIYDFASFTEDLLQRQLMDVMKWFSERLQAQECLVFEVFDYDISFCTRTMAFESSNNATFKPKVHRSQRLSVCKETAYFY